MKSKHNLGKFYLVLLVFALPMAISGLLYYFHPYLHFKTMNHGQFITPPVQTSSLLKNSFNTTTANWQIIHVDNGHCENECQHINYQLAQIRKVFGKDQERITIQTLHAQDDTAKQLQTLFNQQSKTQLHINEKIFLMDPLGNIFMFYSETAKPMDIFKDLKRVLEVSQIG